MHRQSAYASAAGLILGLATGCALPKVGLGASVSLGRAAGQDGARHTRMRSALWIAMIYAPGSSVPEPERDFDHDSQHDFEPKAAQPSETPCEFELACAFEQAAIETERERELPP
jgi:hypothetical protein